MHVQPTESSQLCNCMKGQSFFTYLCCDWTRLWQMKEYRLGLRLKLRYFYFKFIDAIIICNRKSFLLRQFPTKIVSSIYGITYIEKWGKGSYFSKPWLWSFLLRHARGAEAVHMKGWGLQDDQRAHSSVERKGEKKQMQDEAFTLKMIIQCFFAFPM